MSDELVRVLRAKEVIIRHERTWPRSEDVRDMDMVPVYGPDPDCQAAAARITELEAQVLYFEAERDGWKRIAQERQSAYVDLFDRTQGTPCEQIRHAASLAAEREKVALEAQLRHAQETALFVARTADAEREKVARLVEAGLGVVQAADQARMTPRPGNSVGGMTIEANIRGSVYNGLAAWPVEELRAALDAVQAQEGEG